METRRQKSLFCSSRGMVFIAALLVCAAFIVAWSMPIMAAASQKLFSTPEDALKGLVEAVKLRDKAALDQIFGPTSKDLLSGDAVQDAAESEEFARHVAEKTSLVKENDSKVIIYI